MFQALSNYDLAADDSEESLEDMASFKKKSEEQFDIYIVGFNESAKIKNKVLSESTAIHINIFRVVLNIDLEWYWI